MTSSETDAVLVPNDGDALQHERHAPERPAEHALLGLLMLAGGTAHGYELARQFRQSEPLGAIIHLEPAMLYKHLKKLSRLGWLTMSLVDQSPRPPRQVCHLTPTGEAELRRWLAEPVARTREVRLEFLVKLYFAWQLDPGQASRLVAQQHEATSRIARAIAGQLADAQAVNAEQTSFQQLVLELRLEQTRAAAEWLAQVASVIDAGESTHLALNGDASV